MSFFYAVVTIFLHHIWIHTEIVRLIESRFHDIRIEKSVNKVRDYRKYDSIYEKLKRKEAVSI